MLKYFLALFAIALAWAAVLVFDAPMWVGILVSAVAVLGVVLVIVFRRMQASKAAREIEKSLAKQAAAFAENARPDQQADIEAMQAEFNKAIRALKSSRLARQGTDAMAALPWYMIIGPPGAGKSTALKNSGLQFPYLSSRGGGVRGVGGTRNCDWWLTNEAIILDTAGRYATEDDDQDEWFGFLEMLKRHRARRPINGVLVAVNVAELGGASEEEVADLAKRIRDRVDEVMNHLKVVVPVYLLCTKCDLVPGFVETWNELKKNERGQIWGFTFPLEPDNPEPGEAFTEKFDELMKVVELRSLGRMAAERRIEVRKSIYEFPQQLEALRANLIEFVAQAFAGNVYQETPILRGVYFTSGTQEGRPIDRVTQKMAEAFGVRPRVAQAQAPGEARSYFLRDVFSRVIFPDRNVAAASGAMSRKELAVRSATVAGVFLVALLLSLLPLGAYFKNRRLIASTRAVTDALVAAAPTRAGGPLADDQLEPVLADIDLCADTQDGPSPMMRLGMYQGDEIFPALARAIRTSLIRPFTDDFERGGGDARSYDNLKLYLLLTRPKVADEPEPEASEWKPMRALITTSVREYWAHRAPSGLASSGKKAIEKLVRLYLSEAEDDPATLLSKRDQTAVDAARAALRAATDPRAGIDKLLADVDCRRYDVSLGQILSEESAWFKGDSSLPGAFTVRCWEEQVRPRLSVTKKEEDAWVTGPKPAKAASDDDLAQLRSDYFKRYIEAWNKFLRSVKVAPQPDMEKGVAMLRALTEERHRPFNIVLKTLDDNTKLKEGSLEEAKHWGMNKAKGALDTIKNFVGAKTGKDGAAKVDSVVHVGDNGLYGADKVGERFATLLALGGLGGPEKPGGGGGADSAKSLLDSYNTQLERLLEGAENYRQDKDHDKFKMLLQTATTTVQRWITGHKEDNWDFVLDAWFMPPINSLTVALETESGGGTNAAWCEAVVGPFEDLKKKYPFTDNGKDADMTAVMQFFQPGKGAIWGHYEGFLKKDFVHLGQHYKLKEGGASASYQGGVAAFLDKVQEITDFLFPTGGPQPSVPLEIRLKPTPNVTKIVFDVDGQDIQYRNEPERWIALKWPGDKHTGASIRAFGKRGEEFIPFQGEWGLFHLIDLAKVSKDADILSATWKLNTSETELHVDMRPAKLHHLLKGFTVPKSIANGPSECVGAAPAGGGK
jgi:type VI secretion system protein ImpL